MVTEIKKTEFVKGILIDPEKETVTEIELTRDEEGSLLHELYRVIGCDCVDCLRDCVGLNGKVKNDDVWVDDEALLNDPRHFWRFASWLKDDFIAGRAVILDYDPRDGASMAHSLTPAEVADLRAIVEFAHMEE